MTDRKCPIEYGSSDTCNESVYHDCTYPKGLNGCARIESLRERKMTTRYITEVYTYQVIPPICPNKSKHVSAWPAFDRIPCPYCKKTYVRKI